MSRPAPCRTTAWMRSGLGGLDRTIWCRLPVASRYFRPWLSIAPASQPGAINSRCERLDLSYRRVRASSSCLRLAGIYPAGGGTRPSAISIVIMAMQESSNGLWTASASRAPVRAVAVGTLDDRDRIVSAGADGTVRVWDPGTGAELAQLTGHTGWVWAVGTLDGRDRIVSAGADWTGRRGSPRTCVIRGGGSVSTRSRRSCVSWGCAHGRDGGAAARPGRAGDGGGHRT